MAALVRFRATFGAGCRLFGAARGAGVRNNLANPLKGTFATGLIDFCIDLLGLDVGVCYFSSGNI
jgi:hypothetical protein